MKQEDVAMIEALLKYARLQQTQDRIAKNLELFGLRSLWDLDDKI